MSALSAKLSVLAALALAQPVAALAQTAPAAIQPPGRGMFDDPCPAQTVPARPIREPGKPVTVPPEAAAANAANSAYVKQYDWAWLCRYRADNAAVMRGVRPRVVFMGDSITEGWARYDADLFSKGVIGRGISGQTTPQMLLRFQQDVIALRPRVVHIMAGTNDIAGNTGPTSPDQYKNNIRAMVDLARANRIAVVLASIPPAGSFPWAPTIKPTPRIAELNAWLKGYAAERGLVFADYQAVLAAPDGSMKPGASYDGVHPGTEGYRLMRPVAERAIAAAERGTPRRSAAVPIFGRGLKVSR